MNLDGNAHAWDFAQAKDYMPQERPENILNSHLRSTLRICTAESEAQASTPG